MEWHWWLGVGGRGAVVVVGLLGPRPLRVWRERGGLGSVIISGTGENGGKRRELGGVVFEIYALE